MKLSYLRHFITVYEERNLTRASGKLHTSQPALSNELKSMESEFGTTLFYRQSKELVPTTAADKLYEGALEIIARVDRLHKEIVSLNDSSQIVRIGLPPILGTLVLPGLISRLQTEYPETKLVVSESGSISSLSQLREGLLDAAIISGNDVLPSNIEYHGLTELRICLYVSAENPIASRRSVCFDDLRELPFVLLGDDSFIGAFSAQYFKKNNAEQNVILRTNQLHMIRKLINNNTAASFLYEGALAQVENIVAIPLADADAVKVRFIWSRQMRGAKGIRNIRYLLSDAEKRL